MENPEAEFPWLTYLAAKQNNRCKVSAAPA